MFLNFGLRYAHVNHVGHQFNGPLDGAGIEVGFVGDGSLQPQLFKTTSKVVNFAFQAWSIDVRQGKQLVNAGSHRSEITRGRL